MYFWVRNFCIRTTPWHFLSSVRNILSSNAFLWKICQAQSLGSYFRYVSGNNANVKEYEPFVLCSFKYYNSNISSQSFNKNNTNVYVCSIAISVYVESFVLLNKHTWKLAWLKVGCNWRILVIKLDGIIFLIRSYKLHNFKPRENIHRILEDCIVLPPTRHSHSFKIIKILQK
jgi:hypothetical protein